MRKKLGAAALAVTLVGVFVVVPSVPALAESLPATQYAPTTLTNLPSPSYALSQPDGGVTLGCSGGSIATKRVAADGTVLQDIPNNSPYPNTCARNAAVGGDGTLYTVAVNGSNGFTIIQAVKDSATRWTYEFGCMVAVRGMVVGTNGNLYVLATGLWPCSGMNKLIGLAPEPVNGAPNVVVDTGMAAVLVDGGIAAYTGGLVLRTKDGSQYGVQYVGYDGQLGAGVAVTDMLGLGNVEYADATLAGRIVVASKGGCGSQMAETLTAIGPTGSAWEYIIPTCSQIMAVRPTPSGGAVAHIVKQGIEQLLLVDANGQETASVSVGAVPSGAELVSQTFKVDLHGNIALQRWLKYDGQHKAIQLKTYSGVSGIELGVYELGYDSVSGYGYHTFADLAMGRNTWYVPAFRCWYNNCTSTDTKLYAVTVPGLAMDYPRGAIISPPVSVRDYVALGDSFSSGEGVPPFEEGTDLEGNRCHRSLKAYPRLLHEMPGLGLSLTASVACSGATANEIRSGGNTPQQLASLSPNTGVITITAGGNDVPFKDFVIACLFTHCSDSSVKDGFFDRLSGVGSQLTSLYDGPDSVHSAAPNAKVYVVGYPQLLPESGCAQTDGWMRSFAATALRAKEGDVLATAAMFFIGYSAGLTDSQIETFIDSGIAEFSVSEVATARSLVVQLNGAIKETVGQINQPWLVYVDPLAESSPFRGHELCTLQPYFNGLSINLLDVGHDLPYSYHPNAEGQDAYRNLVIQTMQG